jgi:hypothetical protein
MSEQRNIKNGPFCWQDKATLKLITETFAESNQAVSARSLYLALSELASDEQSETFKARKALIAHRAGLSVKTVERLLHGFEQLGLVKVDRGLAKAGSGSIKSPNTYTLLAMRHGDATSMRHGGKHASKSDKVEESGRISEESKQESSDDDSRSSETLSAQPLAAPSSSISVLNLEDAKKHPLWKQFKAYCESRGGSPTLKGFRTWLMSQSLPKAKSYPKPSSNGALNPPPERSGEERIALVEKFKADNRKAFPQMKRRIINFSPTPCHPA